MVHKKTTKSAKFWRLMFKPLPLTQTLTRCHFIFISRSEKANTTIRRATAAR